MKYLLSEIRNIDGFLTSGRVLIASDFDGTLCPIVCSPGMAQLSPAMSDALGRIGACPNVTMAVISGRPLDDVRRRVAPEFICAGNHGLEIGGPTLEFEHAEARAMRPALAELCEQLSALASAWPGAVCEDKRLSITLHHKNLDARARYKLRFAARRCVARYGRRFLLRSGKNALEICPRVGWDKGAALTLIRDRLGPFDACICLGDDRTDEPMFRANLGGVNVKIGREGQSLAGHYLWEPAETAVLLEYIACVFGLGATTVKAAAQASSMACAEMA